MQSATLRRHVKYFHKNAGLLIFAVVIAANILFLAGCIGTDLVGEIPEDDRIEVSVQVPAAEIGQQLQVQAVYYNSDGSVDAAAVFQWHSTNNAVATVDASGLVMAHSAGQTTIVASSMGTDSNALTLTIVSDINQVAMVEVSPETLTLAPFETAQLGTTSMNVLGETIPNGSITYVSADPSIASVDADGLVTAHVPGITSITAAIDGVVSSPIEVRVLGVQLQGNFSARQGTVYMVEGTAVLREDNTGFVTLSFQGNFQSSDGPGLHVYLSTSDGVSSSSIDLGDLKSTTGSQQYSVGGTLDTTAYRYVVIHCVPFNVTFGSARLN